MSVPLPPRWVRRPVTLLVVLGLAVAVGLVPVLVVVPLAVLLPLLVVIGLSLVLPVRWRVVRLLGFALLYLAVEVAGLAAALVLWVASGFGWRLSRPAWQRAHYEVLRAVLQVLVHGAEVLFRVQVVDDEVGWSPLDDGVPGSTNAMLVLPRHAGPGDSLLLMHTLLNRDHDRQPRVVLKDVLQLDPLLDVFLNRLPNAFLAAGTGNSAAQVAALAQGLGERDALLLFPEGGNFSEVRRVRAIDRLRHRGMHEQAEAAGRMRHVLPPRPGGVAAALSTAPHADVVLVAHTGLEHLSTVRDLWRGLPMDATVRMRWWFVGAADVPREARAQERWLYERWAEVDAWVDARVGAGSRAGVRPVVDGRPSRPA